MGLEQLWLRGRSEWGGEVELVIYPPFAPQKRLREERGTRSVLNYPTQATRRLEWATRPFERILPGTVISESGNTILDLSAQSLSDVER